MNKTKLITMIKRAIKGEFLEYDNYKQRIDFLDTFSFQQYTRRRSVKNMKGCGQ